MLMLDVLYQKIRHVFLKIKLISCFLIKIIILYIQINLRGNKNVQKIINRYR